MTEYLSNLPPLALAFLLVTAVCICISFWAILHAFHREFPTSQEKMLWMGVAVFVPFAGGIVYMLVGRKRGRMI